MKHNEGSDSSIVKSIRDRSPSIGVSYLRIRAGLLVGRLNDWTLRLNAKSASDRWIREVCWSELERRKELDQ